MWALYNGSKLLIYRSNQEQEDIPNENEMSFGQNGEMEFISVFGVFGPLCNDVLCALSAFTAINVEQLLGPLARTRVCVCVCV